MKYGLDFDKHIEDQAYEWYKTTGQYLDPDEYRNTVETAYTAGYKQGVKDEREIS